MSIRNTTVQFVIMGCMLAVACAFGMTVLTSCEQPTTTGTPHTSAEVIPVGSMSPDGGSVYVLVEDIGERTQVSYTLDEFGNPLTCLKVWRAGSDVNDGQLLTYEYDNLELGLDFTCKTAAGSHVPEGTSFGSSYHATGRSVDETPDMKVSYEVSRGEALKRNSGEFTCDFEYYPSGRIKSISPHAPDTSQYVGKVEYDEAGYPIATDVDENALSPNFTKTTESRTIEWEFDADGKPIAYTLGKCGFSGEDRFTVETDEMGNIVRIYDKNGTLKRRMSYQRVDNPSYWARTWAGVFPW